MIRILDLTIDSDILSHTKTHISEYSWFRLNLRCKSSLLCAAKASDTGVLYSEYTIGVKVCLIPRQA